MVAEPDNLVAQFRTLVATASAAILMVMFVADAGWPQSAPPPPLGVQAPAQQTVPPQGGAEPSSPAPEREENPGLIGEIGKMFDKLPTLKSPQDTFDDLNTRAKDAAKDAGDALSRLAKPASMVSGHTICPASANGAADCKLGADSLCQSKGFKEGKSLNTDSAETCSAKVLIPGRARKPGDCRTDYYVTRALCQ